MFEDNRPMPETFSSAGPENFSPFNLDLFFDGSRHLSLSELSAKFTDPESAASGLKKLRENSGLPYSIFALTLSGILQLRSNEREVFVSIKHQHRSEKTIVVISQIWNGRNEFYENKCWFCD